VKNKACKMNKLLLDYFIQTELTRMQPEPEVSKDSKITIRKESTQGAFMSEANEKVSADLEVKPENQNEDVQQSAQKVMLITKCPHAHRKHYAKVIIRLLISFVEYVFKLLQKVRP
jgi:hypothetical protein